MYINKVSFNDSLDDESEAGSGDESGEIGNKISCIIISVIITPPKNT